MGAGTEGRINKMAEGQMRIADEGSTRASNFTYNASNITRMSWPDGRYEIAGVEIAGVVHKAGEVDG